MIRHLIIFSWLTLLVLLVQKCCLACLYTYPECGITDESLLTQKYPAPWAASVAVFEEDFVGWEYLKILLTGVIISSTKILTVWSSQLSYLLYGDINSYKLPPAWNILVSVGFQSQNIRHFDIFPQDSEHIWTQHVIQYFINSSSIGNTSYPILLHLTTPLNFSNPFVKPICISTVPRADTNETYPSIASGFEHYFGKESSILIKPSALKLEDDTEFCEWILTGTTNKTKYWFGKPICAYPQPFQIGDVNRKDNYFCGAETITVATKYDGRFYLAGFASQGHHNPKVTTSCYSSRDAYYHAFDIQNERIRLWILQNIACKDNEFACPNNRCIPIRQVCNHIHDCSPSDGSSVDENVLLCTAINSCKKPDIFSCGIGDQCLRENQLCDGTPDCAKTSADENPEICRDFVKKHAYNHDIQTNIRENTAPSAVSSTRISMFEIMTKPSNTSSLTAGKFCKNIATPAEITKECSIHGKIISCQELNKARTKMELKCAPYYTATSKFKSVELTCSEDGSWEPTKFLTCEAECGRLDGIVDNGADGYIADGYDLTSRKRFPWYAAIFVSNTSISHRRKNKFEFACGASLIEESFVLTAANCVTDKDGHNIELDRIRVVLAPESRNFDDNVLTKTSVIRKVSEVQIPPTFDLKTLNSDVSLVRLSEPIQFSGTMQPICYLTCKEKDVPSLGSIGLLAGFGKSVNDRESEEKLTFGLFPIVSNLNCFKKLPQLAGLNKFCAGNYNVSQASICLGDNGGGIVFREYTRNGLKYSLKGIVSKIKEDSDDNCESLQIFTHVDAFSDWVLEIMERVID